jgi:hypothetical protein
MPDAAAGLIAREQQRQRRFVLAAQPAEQIEFPGQLEPVGAVLVRRILAGRSILRLRVRRLPDAVADAAVDLG